jgi:single-stranded DNA-binding protein
MHSFTLTAVGNLARNPELVVRSDTSYARFCLMGCDHAARDDTAGTRDLSTSAWFVAFGTLGEVIARTARKGDQLFVTARMRASSWVDKQGERQYEHSFVVSGFRFGATARAKREEHQTTPAGAAAALSARAAGAT